MIILINVFISIKVPARFKSYIVFTQLIFVCGEMKIWIPSVIQSPQLGQLF